MSVPGLFILNRVEDLVAIDVGTALFNDSVANLADEDHKARRGVVVG